MSNIQVLELFIHSAGYMRVRDCVSTCSEIRFLKIPGVRSYHHTLLTELGVSGRFGEVRALTNLTSSSIVSPRLQLNTVCPFRAYAWRTKSYEYSYSSPTRLLKQAEYYSNCSDREVGSCPYWAKLFLIDIQTACLVFPELFHFFHFDGRTLREVPLYHFGRDLDLLRLIVLERDRYTGIVPLVGSLLVDSPELILSDLTINEFRKANVTDFSCQFLK